MKNTIIYSLFLGILLFIVSACKKNETCRLPDDDERDLTIKKVPYKKHDSIYFKNTINDSIYYLLCASHVTRIEDFILYANCGKEDDFYKITCYVIGASLTGNLHLKATFIRYHCHGM